MGGSGHLHGCQSVRRVISEISLCRCESQEYVRRPLVLVQITITPKHMHLESQSTPEIPGIWVQVPVFYRVMSHVVGYFRGSR